MLRMLDLALCLWSSALEGISPPRASVNSRFVVKVQGPRIPSTIVRTKSGGEVESLVCIRS
jgi:hypothetical protein